MLPDSVSPPSAELLDAFVTGRCSPEDTGRVERWLATASAYTPVITAMREWSREDVDIEAWLIRVKTSPMQIRRTPHVGRFSGKWTLRERNFVGKALGAMATGIIVLVAIAFGRYSTTDANGEIVKTYTTPVGQRASLLLEDGTHVRLAPRTTIGVTRGFGRQTRVVTLRGEAIFDVPNASGVPFVVQTGAVTTRVLGTRFDIRRYDTDVRTRIAVVSGKVVVAGRVHSGMTLTAGAIGDVTDSTAIVVSQDAAARAIAWGDGILVFHKAPTADVLAELTRWYGYEFLLADSALATKNVTARFQIDSPSAALANLKLLLDVDLVFDGNLITLHQRHRDHMLQRDRRGMQDTFNFIHSEVGR